MKYPQYVFRSLIITFIVACSLIFSTAITAQEPTKFAKITMENVTQLAWQHNIGLGALINATWSADGKTLFALTQAGVYRYDLLDAVPTLVSGTINLTSNAYFSSDVRWLATILEYRRNQVRISNLETGEYWMAIEDPQNQWLKLYFAGDVLVALSQSDRVWLYDLQKKRTLRTIDGVVDVAVHPDSKRFAIQGQRGLSLWDITTQQEIGRFAGLNERNLGMQFSGDGKTLYTLQVSKGINAYDVKTLQPKYHLPIAIAKSIRYDAQANVAVTWGNEAPALSVQAVDLEQGHLLPAVKITDTAPKRAIEMVDVALAADGTRFATFSWDNRLRVWDTNTGEMLAERITEKADFLSFRPDSTEIVFNSPAGLVSYNYATDQLKSIAGQYGLNHGHVEFSPDGRWLAATAAGNMLHFWELGAWDKRYELQLPLTNTVSSVDHFSFSPDSRYMIIGSHRQVWWYDLTHLGSANPADALQPIAEESCFSVAFSRDGKYMGCALNSTVLIWDASSLKLLWDYAKDAQQEAVLATRFAFAPDSTKLAISTGKGRIDVITLPDFHLTQHPVSSEEFQTTLVFSPDSKRLALTTTDNVFRVYDTATWQEIWSAHGLYRSELYGLVARRYVEFGPDDRLLAVGDIEKQVRFYNATTGELIFDLKPNASGEGLYDARGITFSPDGTLLVGSTEPGVLMLWGVPIAE
jgi:WD40 repeat protein